MPWSDNDHDHTPPVHSQVFVISESFAVACARGHFSLRGKIESLACTSARQLAAFGYPGFPIYRGSSIWRKRAGMMTNSGAVLVQLVKHDVCAATETLATYLSLSLSGQCRGSMTVACVISSACFPPIVYHQMNAGADTRAEATAAVEDKFAGRQQELEMTIMQVMVTRGVSVLGFFVAAVIVPQKSSTSLSFTSGCTRVVAVVVEFRRPPRDVVFISGRFITFRSYVLCCFEQEMEPVHLEQQLALRQHQLHEVAGTVKASKTLSAPPPYSCAILGISFLKQGYTGILEISCGRVLPPLPPPSTRFFLTSEHDRNMKRILEYQHHRTMRFRAVLCLVNVAPFAPPCMAHLGCDDNNSPSHPNQP